MQIQSTFRGKTKLLALFGIVALTFMAITASWVMATSDDTPSHHSVNKGIHWESWSDEVFERAKKENKFLVLDLEAVWCHWCHVMREKTYSDPAVIKLIQDKYIAIRVDQDSRPDLATRYMEYGWPATIFYGPDGTELVKRAGYIAPANFSRLLQAIIDDPTPEKFPGGADALAQFSESPYLSEGLKKSLESLYYDRFDNKLGSWGRGPHKYLDWDSVEYAMAKAKAGDLKSEFMAKKTLKAQLNLLDPVWGGMYQYSHGYVWTNPHFEKIMSIQAENLKIYAQAYSLWQDPLYLKTAQSIHGFIKTFLTSPEGVFYTSMDADVVQGKHSDEYFELNDAQRLQQGVPRVDQHIYARENGWVIHALTYLYEATGDEQYLNEATTAANWMIKNRHLVGGGFRHDKVDKAGPYLGDTLSMGRAFLSMYRVTGERHWLMEAERAAHFIEENFKNADERPGFIAAVQTSAVLKPVPLRDENVQMARFANRLFHATGNEAYKKLSENAMRFIATPKIANIPYAASTLLADDELSKAPTHITVVGRKDDPAAISLFQQALRYPSSYKRLDWWDRREGPMPNADVQYPELKKAAAFVCTNNRCSIPVFKPSRLNPLVKRLTGDSITP